MLRQYWLGIYERPQDLSKKNAKFFRFKFYPDAFRYYVFSIDYEYSHFEGTISETDFLARMGSLSMKTVRLIGGAFVSEDPSDPPNPLSLRVDSDDSLR